MPEKMIQTASRLLSLDDEQTSNKTQRVMRNEIKKTEETRYFYIGGGDLSQTQRETIGKELAQANSKDGWNGVRAVLEKYSRKLEGSTIRITDATGKILFDGLFNQIMRWVEQQIALQNLKSQRPKRTVDKAQQTAVNSMEDQKGKKAMSKNREKDLDIAEKQKPKAEEQKIQNDFFQTPDRRDFA